MLTINDIFKSFRLELTSERKELITKAYNFAMKAHAGQKRFSGEDYIQHSLGAANILAEMGMGARTISSALLHDVPEDTEATLEEIEKEFGLEIARIVDGCTKLSKLRLRGTKRELYIENLRKMFFAMAEDVRVIIIKLADRLHNMRTLEYVRVEKRERIAQETMEIFAPIANRLGIGGIKGELEDLAFKHLDPQNYEYVKGLEETNYRQAEKYIKQAEKELRSELEKSGIKVLEIYGRAKHLYRLFLKLQKYDMDIYRIYDLAAIRIIVPEMADCYESLGIVHKKYRPMVGRSKDYISLPKPNGYQSIHTTVFGPEGKILEVQIRTQKMHDEAEFGIAAHWIYSEKERKSWMKMLFGGKKSRVPKEEISWVAQLQEWQNEIGRDDAEFVEGLKIDFFKNHIFAFTPRGDIIDLPEEATPVDFAYAIHSEIGERAVGAKVDGKMVPLNYQIKNGQMVEILTAKDRKKPNRNWLRFVKTSVAKSHIRKALKKREEL